MLSEGMVNLIEPNSEVILFNAGKSRGGGYTGQPYEKVEVPVPVVDQFKANIDGWEVQTLIENPNDRNLPHTLVNYFRWGLLAVSWSSRKSEQVKENIEDPVFSNLKPLIQGMTRIARFLNEDILESTISDGRLSQRAIEAINLLGEVGFTAERAKIFPHGTEDFSIRPMVDQILKVTSECRQKIALIDPKSAAILATFEVQLFSGLFYFSEEESPRLNKLEANSILDSIEDCLDSENSRLARDAEYRRSQVGQNHFHKRLNPFFSNTITALNLIPIICEDLIDLTRISNTSRIRERVSPIHLRYNAIEEKLVEFYRLTTSFEDVKRAKGDFVSADYAPGAFGKITKPLLCEPVTTWMTGFLADT